MDWALTLTLEWRGIREKLGIPRKRIHLVPTVPASFARCPAICFLEAALARRGWNILQGGVRWDFGGVGAGMLSWSGTGTFSGSVSLARKVRNLGKG